MYDEKDDLDELELDPGLVEGLTPEELAKLEKEFEEFKDRLRAKRRARDREKAKRGDLSDADLEDLSEYATKEFGRLINVWLGHKMSIGASINANIIYPRFGADGKIALDLAGKKIGDHLTFKDGKIIACLLIKPEAISGISPAFIKEGLERKKSAQSITFDEKNPMFKEMSKAALNGLLKFLKDYRSAVSEYRQGVHDKLLSYIEMVSEGRKLQEAELIADPNEPGKYSIDFSKIKEAGLLKVPHLDENGKPTGKFDIIVHDKNGKIIDGVILDGSSLNVATKNSVREAVLDRELQGVDKSNPKAVAEAHERASIAAGLSGSKDLGVKRQEGLALEDELIARTRPIGMGGKAEGRGAEEIGGTALAALDNAGVRRERNAEQGRGPAGQRDSDARGRQAPEDIGHRLEQPARETHAEPDRLRETRLQEPNREPIREAEHRPSEATRSREPAQRPREPEEPGLTANPRANLEVENPGRAATPSTDSAAIKETPKKDVLPKESLSKDPPVKTQVLKEADKIAGTLAKEPKQDLSVKPVGQIQQQVETKRKIKGYDDR